MGTFSDGTTLADSQQAIALSTAAWVKQLNGQRQQIYDGAVRDYNLNMGSGQKHDPPLVPPVAPFGYVVGAPDANGYVWPVIGTERLTPTPPLTVATVDNGTLTVPVPIANHISINWASRNGLWVTANKDDGMPGGFKTPPLIDDLQPSNPPHAYQRYTGPVGPGWYLQVS